MASRLSWLLNLKLEQLETIALATGIKTSGAKPAVITNLKEGLSSPTPNGESKRREDGYSILSIDPGVRNFAYCHLALPASWLHDSCRTPSSTGPLVGNITTPSPRSWAWLHNSPRTQSSTDFVASDIATPSLKSWARLDVTASNAPSENDPEKKEESLSPPTYASYAYNLLTRTLLPLNPTHILIERQRYRSMGGSTVQEWTLRVNMFEAMLYATLFTLKQKGLWNGEVVPINPAKVGKYWLPGKSEKGKKPDSKTKAKKMEVVRGMVRDGWGVELPEERGESGVPEGDRETKLLKKNKGLLDKSGDLRKGGKFDDLADCLLQGLAWCRWQENRRAVWEMGQEVLDRGRLDHVDHVNKAERKDQEKHSAKSKFSGARRVDTGSAGMN
ncbi:MAG: hypothetical protein Q9228_005958 [Teloschistes exilis]